MSYPIDSNERSVAPDDLNSLGIDACNPALVGQNGDWTVPVHHSLDLLVGARVGVYTIETPFVDIETVWAEVARLYPGSQHCSLQEGLQVIRTVGLIRGGLRGQNRLFAMLGETYLNEKGQKCFANAWYHSRLHRSGLGLQSVESDLREGDRVLFVYLPGL